MLIDGSLPSLLHRLLPAGRTGEFHGIRHTRRHQSFCHPNALSPSRNISATTAPTRPLPAACAPPDRAAELNQLPDGPRKQELRQRLESIRRSDQHDLYF